MKAFRDWTAADVAAFNRRNKSHSEGDQELRRESTYAKRTDQISAAISHAEQRQQPQELGGNNAREAQGAECPHVRFTLVRVRLLDVDAKYASCKDLIDGLAAAGLIPGDKEGQITLEVNQQKVSRFSDERTVIEIL